LELSKRLAAVARNVPDGVTVADIGTDHAYLPVYLVREGRTARVVAGEISRGPYKSALSTLRTQDMEKQIDLRLGDGLDILAPGEVEVITLAGMGGKTVCEILDAGRRVIERVKLLIIQPMGDAPVVRRWLLENDWSFANEEMVYEDGHYYVIIVAKPGLEVIRDDFLLDFGPRLIERRDTVFYGYLQKKLAEIKAVLFKLEFTDSEKAREKVSFLHKQAARIEEVLKYGG